VDQHARFISSCADSAAAWKHAIFLKLKKNDNFIFKKIAVELRWIQSGRQQYIVALLQWTNSLVWLISRVSVRPRQIILALTILCPGRRPSKRENSADAMSSLQPWAWFEFSSASYLFLEALLPIKRHPGRSGDVGRGLTSSSFLPWQPWHIYNLDISSGVCWNYWYYCPRGSSLLRSFGVSWWFGA
jgi:hypothetical protein